jgi:rhamnogalacturonyl hydrolase YesR
MSDRKLLVALLAAGAMSGALAADKPAANEVLAIMQKVADWQLANPSPKPPWCWEKGALYAGVMALGDLVPSTKYRDAMMDIGRTNAWKPGPRRYHADDYAVGQMYCEMFQLYRDPAMLAPLRAEMDGILAKPDTRPIGGAIHAGKNKQEPMRYWWCDALFMGPPALIRLNAVTGEQKYLDFMIQEWKATSDYLFDKEEHLYFRDNSYFKKREKNGKKIFWSRGNGWVMGGLVRVLQVLPAEHPDRKFFETQFTEMAEKILAIQQPDGVWHSSLLNPEAFPVGEASGTSFFCYALTWGINQGLLDRAKFEPAVLKAWRGLCGFVQEDGKLTHVQQVGAAPESFKAEHTDTYGIGAFLLAGSEIYRLVLDKPGVTVQVTSELDAFRPQQTIELDLTAIQAKLPDAKAENVAVLDAAAGRWLLSQVVEGKLLFQSDFLPKQTKAFRVIAGVDRAQLPAPTLTTFARFVPERADDFAWENDRSAFRIYGPALWKQDGPTKTGSGVDVWCKRVRQPVINAMYKDGNYHQDNGTSVDCYKVGTARGCGGTAIWADGKLMAGRCFDSWKLLVAGPLRAVFELTYGAWDAGGRKVSEVKRVTLDLGSNFNRFDCTFTAEGEAPLAVAGGALYHKGAELANGSDWTTVWEAGDGKVNGMVGTAVVMPGGEFKQSANHQLLVKSSKPGATLTFYGGAAWSKGVDYPDAAAWNEAAKAFAARVAAPLKVEIK